MLRGTLPVHLIEESLETDGGNLPCTKTVVNNLGASRFRIQCHIRLTTYNPSALTRNSQEINHIFVHNPLFQSFLTEHLNSGIAEPEEIGCLEDIERILRE